MGGLSTTSSPSSLHSSSPSSSAISVRLVSRSLYLLLLLANLAISHGQVKRTVRLPSSSLDSIRFKRDSDCARAGNCDESPMMLEEDNLFPVMKRQQAGYNMWRKGKRAGLYQEDESDVEERNRDIMRAISELKHLIRIQKGLEKHEEQEDEDVEPMDLLRSIMPSSGLKRSPAYSQWRKNGKRSSAISAGSKRAYRDWRKGKRSATDDDVVIAAGGSGLERRSSGMGFKQWRKTG